MGLAASMQNLPVEEDAPYVSFEKDMQEKDSYMASSDDVSRLTLQERLYALANTIEPMHAEAITKMLMELDHKELLTMLELREDLIIYKMQEMMQNPEIFKS